MTRSTPASLLVVGLALSPLLACAPETPPDATAPPLQQAEVDAGYPTLDEACLGPIVEPSHLVVTSTDFHTGAVGLVNLATRTVTPDLAPASSDAQPFVADGRVFVVNRFGFDYIDELDPLDALSLIHEWAIRPSESWASANPHTLVLDQSAPAHAWVTLHGVGQLQRFRFPELLDASIEAELALDLSAFSDPDGIPELSMALRCGELLFVSAERIDRSSWIPASDTLLIPVRAGASPRLFEFDDTRSGPDAIHLLGAGTGPWRLDPDDPSGHTILLLNSGLERVDLASGTSEWLVDEATFADAGYARLQLSGFDLDSQGRIWISAATEDFSTFRLLRVRPGSAPADPPALELAIEGLVSVTGALEIAADIAWFADTSLGSSGLRGFELGPDAVIELPESPLPVGLAPMNFAPLNL